ncbi:MAG: DUF5694 domain-containing protein, partial [Armatimonadetes bacterium]|nr:DUF5694 domain-containing protein [Armatimonadota bacterium]
YPALFNPAGSLQNEVIANLDYPENAVADRAASALGAPLLPFDRENRDEHYAQTHYHEREERASASLEAWLSQLAAHDSDSTDLRTARLAEHATNAQLDLDHHARPETINSPAYDHLIRIKHSLWDHILPALMADHPDHQQAARDFQFLRDEWTERNNIMTDNIAAIAAEYPGRRIAVLTGSEHRYLLRDLLTPNPAITLAEFWRIPAA